jgi:hypothetical protein
MFGYEEFGYEVRYSGLLMIVESGGSRIVERGKVRGDGPG